MNELELDGSRGTTHLCPVKVLHDLDVGHLAVLCRGHGQETEGQEPEGHSGAQHSTSEERKGAATERTRALVHSGLSAKWSGAELLTSYFSSSSIKTL